MKRVSKLPNLPPRRRDAHKGDFGRVLIIGGSTGMIGAPALAANAALRSGAGLVTVACPAPIQPFVAILCPCATTIPLPADRDGRLNPREALSVLWQHGVLADDRRVSAIAIGPGLSLGNDRWSRDVVKLMRGLCDVAPLVIDADALNAIAATHDEGEPIIGLHRCVLTPHPGECARLLHTTTKAVQSDRPASAATLVALLNHQTRDAERNVVVLKGAGTLITNGLRHRINRTGNPGMATGGTGDVLTGTIASLIGQGLALFDAASLGAHLHGLAGDLAAREKGLHGLIATDVVDFIPPAMRRPLK